MEPKPEELVDTLFKDVLADVLSKTSVQADGFDFTTVGKTAEAKAESQQGLWREEPVRFDHFVVAKDHMNQPPLSDRQRSDMLEFLGEDPKRFFLNPESLKQLAVLMWGKGSGKDWIASMVQSYIIYLLLCMRDPRDVLQMPVGEPIDIINVAYSAQQAQSVFFSKFLGRVKNWTWLKRNYLIIESARVINRAQHPSIQTNDDQHCIYINDQEMHFPFKISAYSAHSENESYEGKSPIFWVMDEAAAFRDRGKKANGDKVYDTLRSSAVSRFKRQWRGMAISYPRHAQDFMCQLYKKSADDPTAFCSRAATWEVNPKTKKEDFAEEYRRDPKTARAKYECRPPKAEFGFFDEDNVASIFFPGASTRASLKGALIPASVINPHTGQQEMRNFVGKVVDEFYQGDLIDRARPRVFHVDGGLTGDRAGLVIAHGQMQIVKQTDQDGTVRDYPIRRVVVDLATVWRPDPERGLVISLNNIASVILALRDKGMPIRSGSYDQWNSASSIEALTMAGIYMETHNIDTTDYTNLRNFINLGAVEVPADGGSDWILLRTELEQLEGHGEGNRIKVDHPPLGSKELADCLAGVTRLLNDPAVRTSANVRRVPRTQRLDPAPASNNPFSHTHHLRARGSAGAVGEAIRQSQPLGQIARMASGGDDPDLPPATPEGFVRKFPRTRVLRGR